ncbi:diguanylate cyclase domain-containing protein [Neobacillus sp. NPDC097160]|uniref:diguanylate cyclase domain-containing protein n=1 Tax=Neobacillus sp. NPDC097160 TaxID=3364298 RepID=UPI00381A2208
MSIGAKSKLKKDIFELIWNNTADAIFTIGHDGSVIDANRSFVELFGYSVEELKGLSFPPFFSHITKEEHQEMLQHLRDGKNYPYVVSKRKHKDGTILDVIASYGSINNQSILAVGMYKNFTDQMKIQRKLEHLAFHDPLTGLKNRRKFAEIVNASIKEAEMKNGKIAIMYIDLDNFKSINDSLGHNVGDELLQHFANRLKLSVRKNDELCRIGGDEFLVLLNNISNNKQIEKIAERLHYTLISPYTINNKTFDVTTSIGISVYPEHGLRGRDLISMADHALYRAKERKNQVVFYSINK